MSMPLTTDTVVVTQPAATADHHQAYVDWPAIFAGIVLASAIALILLTFGSAIGLSFANFHGGSSASPIWVGIAAASWLLWVEVSSMMCGGYLAGRMRRRSHDASEHESDVRDGAHGLIVWGGALIIGAVVAVSGVGATVGAIGNIAGSVTGAAASAAGAAASKSSFDPTSYFADALFRPAANAPAAAANAAAPAAAAAAPAATASAGATTTSPANRADAIAEAGRILTNDAISGNVSDADKAYLGDLVARNTGMSADDAKKRIDDVMGQIDKAKQQAADAAETARKLAVLAAFITAASLLVGGVAAYWAAMMGGNHRDKEMVFDYWFRRF